VQPAYKAVEGRLPPGPARIHAVSRCNVQRGIQYHQRPNRGHVGRGQKGRDAIACSFRFLQLRLARSLQKRKENEGGGRSREKRGGGVWGGRVVFLGCARESIHGFGPRYYK
jgi:hypothetical protein